MKCKTGIRKRNKIMKVLLLFSLAIEVSCALPSQNCSQLKNGFYEIEYDSAFKESPKRRLEINNNTCYINQEGFIKKYEIRKTSTCNFWLYDSAFMDERKLTGLQKDLRLGKNIPTYDIYKTEGTSYYFTVKVNGDMTLFSGKFNKRDQ